MPAPMHTHLQRSKSHVFGVELNPMKQIGRLHIHVVTQRGAAWCSVVQYGSALQRGVVWCGVAWRGVALRGVARRGVAWCGVAWCKQTCMRASVHARTREQVSLGLAMIAHTHTQTCGRAVRCRAKAVHVLACAHGMTRYAAPRRATPHHACGVCTWLRMCSIDSRRLDVGTSSSGPKSMSPYLRP